MDFSDFLGFLGDVAGAVAAALQQFFVFIIQIFAYVWNVLVLVAQYLVQVFVDVGKFFEHIWNGFFRGVFTSLFNGLRKAFTFLHNIVSPVLRWLRRASQYIDRIYRVYVRPIIVMLQRVRQFLAIFRALGFKWAAKLDAILGKVQNDIQRAFLLVKQYINVFVDLLNILADPSNLLRRPTTLLSLRRIWHAFMRQVTGVPPGFFIPSPSNLAPKGLGFLSAKFDARDPLQNPPPSYYLAFDGGVPSFNFLGPGETIDDASVDDVSAMDFFNNEIYPGANCIDVASCRDEMVLAAQGVLING